MLQTIMFMIYLLLGACIYTYIEDWEFLDAVYWADFTLLTIGVGDDFTPKTHLGRGLLFPYAIGGIVTVGLVVGSIRSLVLERAKAKMEARMTEKRRERVLSTINRDQQTIKLGAFRSKSFDQSGLSEPQRREQEFNIMRKIQTDSSNRRQWMALCVSTFAFCILWFIGALVFWYSETAQGWSYFVSLYFSYTSLLTIGYGDLQPASNSGRPFFVFWTLLAVPTLTILISNMGDTVVKTIKDLTIWAGSITILPGEQGIRGSIRATVKNARGKYFNTQDVSVTELPGFLPHSAESDDKATDKRRTQIENASLDRIAGHLEEEELHEAQEDEEHGDDLDKDTHFYHYVLAREWRSLMRDVSEQPPKQYTYAEWAYYLMLIGQDETNPDLHRKPKIKPHHEDGNIGNAGGEIRDTDEPPSSDEDFPGFQHLKWSWLGTRSPLLGNNTEPEWILERLSAVLETELKRVRGGKRGMKPPVSMKVLKEYLTAKNKSAEAAEKKQQ